MDLLQELGIETCPQYLEGEKFMQIGSNKVRSYKSVIPSLSPLGLLDCHRIMTKVSSFLFSRNTILILLHVAI